MTRHRATPFILGLAACIAVLLAGYVGMAWRRQPPKPHVVGIEKVPADARPLIEAIVNQESVACRSDLREAQIDKGQWSSYEKISVDKIGTDKRSILLGFSCITGNAHFIVRTNTGSWKDLGSTQMGIFSCKTVDEYRISQVLFDPPTCIVDSSGTSRLIPYP